MCARMVRIVFNELSKIIFFIEIPIPNLYLVALHNDMKRFEGI